MVADFPHHNTGVIPDLLHIFWISVKINLSPSLAGPDPGGGGPDEHNSQLITKFSEPGIIDSGRRILPCVNVNPHQIPVHFLDHQDFLRYPFDRRTTIPFDHFTEWRPGPENLRAVQHSRFPVHLKGASSLADSANTCGKYFVINRVTLVILQGDHDFIEVGVIKRPEIR